MLLNLYGLLPWSLWNPYGFVNAINARPLRPSLSSSDLNLLELSPFLCFRCLPSLVLKPPANLNMNRLPITPPVLMSMSMSHLNTSSMLHPPISNAPHPGSDLSYDRRHKFEVNELTFTKIIQASIEEAGMAVFVQVDNHMKFLITPQDESTFKNLTRLLPPEGPGEDIRSLAWAPFNDPGVWGGGMLIYQPRQGDLGANSKGLALIGLVFEFQPFEHLVSDFPW